MWPFGLVIFDSCFLYTLDPFIQDVFNTEYNLASAPAIFSPCLIRGAPQPPAARGKDEQDPWSPFVFC